MNCFKLQLFRHILYLKSYYIKCKIQVVYDKYIIYYTI